MTAAPPLTDAEIQARLEHSGALRRGHFRLSSGLHSDRYFQCARLFEDPRAAAPLADAMADRLRAWGPVATVLAPALGGILWGYELARALGVRSLFAERPVGGEFALRRSFALAAGERVVLAEDVVTTGGSVLELVPLVESAGAVVVGFASLVDRSGGRFRPAAPFEALYRLAATTWPPEACPLCAIGAAIDKPGSRASRPA